MSHELGTYHFWDRNRPVFIDKEKADQCLLTLSHGFIEGGNNFRITKGKEFDLDESGFDLGGGHKLRVLYLCRL